MSSSRYRDRVGEARRKGFDRTDVKPGAVFTVADQAVYFPGDKGDRTFHEHRWAIVAQSQYSTEERPKTVLVIPCSASGGPDLGDFPLPQEELNGELFTKPSVVAYLNLLQPCPKNCLVECRGQLSDRTWGLLFARVAKLFGLGLSVPLVDLPPREDITSGP